MAKKRRRKKDDPVAELLTGLLFLASIGMYLLTKSAAAAIITFVLVLAIIIAVRMILNQQREERLRRSGIYDIDKMDGRQFELYLGLLFKALGYKTEVTRLAGDYGADLVIEKNGVRTVVQAKCYSKNVGIDAVQQVQASKAHYKAAQAWVVTNRGFTEAAENLAKSNGVTLIGRERLIELMLNMNPATKPKANEVAAAAEATGKTCPRCGKPLVLRKGPKGEFHGCSAFPKCRYTLVESN
ncbi:restriction endonuclease [Paenibacillus rubinfantis]|uniref:restriction endonuclease n=1 Tax=Paenibacillus rubinfantis TaxID=1720296 RepID=UPI00073F74C3|nr:restriction endonuclease [Paenibacillus rubinfantis]